ncbi:MAG: hypothetical protein WC340_09085 [Kiritimatiellia bacterium]
MVVLQRQAKGLHDLCGLAGLNYHSKNRFPPSCGQAALSQPPTTALRWIFQERLRRKRRCCRVISLSLNNRLENNANEDIDAPRTTNAALSAVYDNGDDAG